MRSTPCVLALALLVTSCVGELHGGDPGLSNRFIAGNSELPIVAVRLVAVTQHTASLEIQVPLAATGSSAVTNPAEAKTLLEGIWRASGGQLSQRWQQSFGFFTKDGHVYYAISAKTNAAADALAADLAPYLPNHWHFQSHNTAVGEKIRSIMFVTPGRDCAVRCVETALNGAAEQAGWGRPAIDVIRVPKQTGKPPVGSTPITMVEASSGKTASAAVIKACPNCQVNYVIPKLAGTPDVAAQAAMSLEKVQIDATSTWTQASKVSKAAGIIKWGGRVLIVTAIVATVVDFGLRVHEYSDPKVQTVTGSAWGDASIEVALGLATFGIFNVVEMVAEGAIQAGQETIDKTKATPAAMLTFLQNARNRIIYVLHHHPFFTENNSYRWEKIQKYIKLVNPPGTIAWDNLEEHLAITFNYVDPGYEELAAAIKAWYFAKTGEVAPKSCVGQFETVGACGGTDMFCDKEGGYVCKKCLAGKSNCNRSQGCETAGACTDASGSSSSSGNGSSAGSSGSTGSSSTTQTASCTGWCGKSDVVPGGSCYCDSACVSNGDCCSNYASLCASQAGGAKSCVGHFQTAGYCGGADMFCSKDGGYICKKCPTGTSNCNLTQVCETSGSCDAASSSSNKQGSCSGYCGSVAAVPGTSCYCDKQCAANGDCCTDYAKACP